MSVIAEIAEVVRDELNGHPFSRPFTAARYYVPVFELKDMAVLHVTVVPKAGSEQIVSRARTANEYQIDVAVQKKVDPDNLTEIDALITLVEEIADFFRFMKLTGEPAAVWIRTENDPVYLPDHLERLRQFTSVLTLTFRVYR